MKKCATLLGKLSPVISRAEAFEIYGETALKKWIAAGLIKPNKNGLNNSKLRLSRMELEMLAMADNRMFLIALKN